MDIYYMGDSTSYSSVRSPYYRDYEKFPYGTLENRTPVKSPFCIAQEKTEQNKHKGKQNDNCPFCKEQKKRPLVAYIKKRDCSKRTESICEEDEQEEKISTYVYCKNAFKTNNIK
uniref:CSON000921 protein n=1 Tax=Culicoides sonorensis TaxID=179676 RepID=A0A336K5B4_CULSO